MDKGRLGNSVFESGLRGAIALGIGIEGGSAVEGSVSLERPAGVGTLEMLDGVFTAEGRGLFFDRGRDEGADKKSSGMSFHCSVVLGTGVVLDGARFIGMRGGAEMDLGGGGGRFGTAAAGGGGGGGWEFSLLAAGFFSHPDKDDCSMFAVYALL
jgi:hypothetical protein